MPQLRTGQPGAHRAARRAVDDTDTAVGAPDGPPDGAGGLRRQDLSGPGPDGGFAARWYLREAAAAWVGGRIVVAAALGLVHFLVGSVADNHGVLKHTGLLGWDAGWYQEIATHGYGGAGEESRRFFPLLPMVVRALGAIVGHQGVLLLLLVNALAFVFTVLLARLAGQEGFDDAAVRRVIWLSALAPPAFVLVMGYAEALALTLSVGAFLAARSGRFGLAAVAGLLSGLCRPLGLLLVAPMAIEAARGARGTGPRGWLARLAAVVAPAAGAGIYLAWSAATYHDGLAPLTMQRDAARHGATGNPVSVVWHAATGALHGNVGTSLHVPWLLLAIAGLVVMARRLPASYTAWCGLILLTVLTGSNLDSTERYLLGAFPFLFVAALVTGQRTVWPLVLTASTATMTVYATLAFTLSYVP
ncbi:hypothetical protein [Pseudofrankia sp. DC12]|uniref:hypothetical protein n=1 Tax=Pseudofrankia sp. DC12 TaxID=683315 RepID=UPI0005F791EA|nr:hypothetical protein [Pseudofrankia sp. DC12]